MYTIARWICHVTANVHLEKKIYIYDGLSRRFRGMRFRQLKFLIHCLCLCRSWLFSPAKDLLRNPHVGHVRGLRAIVAGILAAALDLSLAACNFVKLTIWNFCIPLWHRDLHWDRSLASCSKLWGIPTADKLLFSLSLYRSHGRPTFRCPWSSWLYIRTLGILSSSILKTWPAHRSCDFIRKVSIPPIWHLLKSSTLEILSLRLYLQIALRQLLWKTSNCLICSLYGVQDSDP